METRGPKIEIRRKPVASGRKPPKNGGVPATVDNDTTTEQVTSAQVRDVSDLDMLTATFNSRGCAWSTDDDVSAHVRSSSREPRSSPNEAQMQETTRATGPQPSFIFPSFSELSGRSSVDTGTRSRSVSADSRPWLPADSKSVDSTRQQAPQAKEHISLYFSRSFLVGMATTFVIMTLGLEILNLFSERNKGIVAVEEENHYLWTYGPTFILTLFVALWGQLEHRAKHLMPWLAMMNEPAEAEHGILLDYITPLTIGSLVKSAKRKHFLVTLAILGSFLLRALVIVSTGLLAVRQQTMVREANVTMLDQFNLTKHSLSFTADAGLTIWATTQRNVSYPLGTTDIIAAQSMDLSGYDAGVTLEAPMVVFEPKLVECMEFSWTVSNADISWNNSIAHMASPEEMALLEQFCFVDLFGPPGFKVLGREHNLTRLAGGFMTVKAVKRCKEVEVEGEDPWRIFVPIRGSLPGNRTAYSTVICHPTYTLTRPMVRYESTPGNAGAIVSVDPRVIEDLPLRGTPSNITRNILDTLTDSVQRLGPYKQNEDTWYKLLNYTDPQPTMADVGNLIRFSRNWQRVFKMVAVQVVKGTETERANSTVAGSLSYTSNRLVVEQVPLRTMESLLIVLAIISLAFCFFPFASLPTRSGFMITLASILSRSPQLLRSLSGTGAGDKASLRNRLSMFRFYLVNEPSSSQVAIALQPKKTSVFQRIRAKANAPPPHNGKWWKPTGASPAYKLSLIAFTMGIAGSLEGLLQHSASNQGLANVSTEDYTRYAWLFLPTINMAVIALAYSTLDVTYRLLHPFQQLQQAKGPNVQALRYDPLGKLTATAFFRALGAKHFALAAAMFTSLLGPMLTIAASGLFSTALAPTEQPVRVDIDGWFNISSGYFNTASYNRLHSLNIDAVPDVAINQAILFNGLSFSPGTYEGLVFPKMRVVPPKVDDASLDQTTLVARVPAIRSQMNCSVLLSAENQTFSRAIDGARYYGFEVKPPAGCSAPKNANFTGDRSTLLLGHGFFWPQASGYFSTLLDGWYTYPKEEELVDDRYSPFRVCDDGLQHIFATVGHRTNQVLDHVGVLHCMPYLEVVDVDAAFVLPSLANSPDPARSPKVVEGTARPWVAGSDARNSVLMPPLRDLPHKEKKIFQVNIDRFHIAVFEGKGGRPIEQLATPDATPEMIERMGWVHSVLVAQSLNEHYRSSAPGPGSPKNGYLSAVNGSVVDESPVRLMQSSISTRILEGLLLAMLLCSVVVFCLSGSAEILPKNPGSIASRMSLLADSTILKHIADMDEDFVSAKTCEDWKDADAFELNGREKDLFTEDTFSLGWWHDEGGSSRYGIDLGMADSSPR